MRQESVFTKVWRVLTPLATYYILQIIAMIGVSAAFAMRFVSQIDLNGTNIDSVYASLMESVFNSILDISFWCTVFSAVAVIPFLLMFRKKDRKRAAMQGRSVRYTKAGSIAYAIFPLLACAASLAGNNLMLMSGFFQGTQSAAVVSGEIVYSQSLLATIIGVGVIAPAAEEMIFRVVMYDRVREYMRPLYAGLITSALYASLHMGLVQMIYGFLLGAMFAYGYEKTHDWKIPVAMHICLNIMDILVTDTSLFRFMYASRSVMIGITLAACAAVVGLMYLAEMKISSQAVLAEGQESTDGEEADRK